MINKYFITIAFFIPFTSFALSEKPCESEMDVYNKTQTITSSLLYEMDNPEKLMEMTEYYGEQTQKANALVKEGKFQEACDVYQGVIDKYGFKTIEERYYEKHPEKRPENQKNIEAESPAESSVSSEAAGATAPDSSSGD